jgi:hypothetical protein
MMWFAWLKQNSFLAAWLSPAIALIGMLIRGGGTKGNALDWARMMLYISFLSCLAAVFTPAIDDGARTFGGCGVLAMSIYFMVQSHADAELRRAAERKALGLPEPPPPPPPSPAQY